MLMEARFVGKIYVFQTAWHANCDSEYDIYHIRGLYSGLTVIHFTNRLCMVETYLKFTVESGEEFEGGWLPTLDTNLRVGGDRLVQFKFYEKSICSKKTFRKLVQWRRISKFKLFQMTW